MGEYEKAALPSRSITTGSLIEKFQAIARRGFGGVSILPSELTAFLRQHGEQGLKELNATGLRLLVHGAAGEAGSAGCDERIESQVRIAEQVHAITGSVANLVFDPGFRRDAENRFFFDPGVSIEALKRASRLQDDHGITVGIENWPSGPYLSDLEGLSAQLSSSSIGFLLDLGHLFIAQRRGLLGDMTVRDFVTRVPFPICEIHVHDNDGARDSHLTLGEGEIDQEEYADALRDLPGDAWITIESRPGGTPFPIDDDRGFAAAVDSIGILTRLRDRRERPL
jgi:sugar phosphate isomerase/epimerase